MGKKELLIAALRKPYQIPRYLWGRHGLRIYNNNIRRRVPFRYDMVVDGWGEKGAGLPQFSNRLFHEVKLLEKALKDVRADKSLEIGCGYGRLTPWIMQYSKEHYAIEPEEELFNAAKYLNPEAHFYKAKAQTLPFPDETFDLIVSWTVLQHIPPREQIKAINEITRVAKQSATLVLAEGVGNCQAETVWLHTVEEWQDLFKPWSLIWQTDRVLGNTSEKGEGKMMRFTKP
jgi:SAM-dependent methyltransferase